MVIFGLKRLTYKSDMKDHDYIMDDGLKRRRIMAVGLLVLAACCFSLYAAEDNQGPVEPAKMVTDYALTSASSTEGKDPANWQLVASNDDGKSWALLDEQTHQSFAARSQRRIFHITNQTSYQVYRLIVSTVSETRLGELELIGPAVNVPREADLEVVRTSSGPHPMPTPVLGDGSIGKRMDALSGGHCSWVQYKYTTHAATHAAVNLIGYALTSANDMPGSDPRDWRLLGSNNRGKTWDLLDERHDESFTNRRQRREFTLANPAMYETYRLQIDSVFLPGVLSRVGWVPSASVSDSSNPPTNTIDGSPSTRWGSGVAQTSGQWFQMDMKTTNTIFAIVLDATGSPGDYPRGYQVTLSMDAINWSGAVATGAGNSAVTTIPFAAQSARYIRVTQTGSISEFWWSIHEFNVFGVAGDLPAKATNGLGSVQLAEIEPILGFTNEDSNFSLAVSAQGEDLPLDIATAAFDGNPETKWLDFSGLRDPVHHSSWIQWQYTRPTKDQSGDLGWLQGGIIPAGPAKIVTSYALTSASSVERPDPANWQLAGSNDGGVSWETLDSQTNQGFAARSQRREFPIPNRKAFSAYRLTITGLTSVTLAELELLGPAVNVIRDADLEEEITASGEQPVIGPAKQAFDHDVATKWMGLASIDEPCWIQCQYVSHAENVATKVSQILILSQRLAANPVFDDQRDILSKLHAASKPTPKMIGYALTSANDHSERDPRDWRLLGMNEDGTWDTIDERHNESFSRRFQRRQFTMTNPGAYAAYRLEIDSVRRPSGSGGDSVQLAEIEPLYGAGGGDDTFSLVVSAEGENPPRETIDSVFDGDLESKWLDFLSSAGQTNRTSWIQWQYIPRVKERIINLRWLQGTGTTAAEPTHLRLEGVVVSWNPETRVLGFLDETGFQTFKLANSGLKPNPGDRIRLGGQLKFENGQTVVQEPELTDLGLATATDETNPDSVFASGQKFAYGSIAGNVNFVSGDSEQASFRMNRNNGGGSLSVRILNLGHLPNNFFVPGCRLRAQGIIQPVLNQKLQPVAGVVWVPDLDHITLECASEQDWLKWPESSLTTLRQASVSAPLMVRVRGSVVEQRPGVGLTISDGTNQIFAASRQTNTFALETTVEVLGFLTKSNDQPALCLAQVRLAPESKPLAEVAANGAPESVTSIRNIRELALTHPTNELTVKIRGVITYIDLGFDIFYIQDGTGGMIMANQLGAGIFPFLQQEGMYVEVQGHRDEWETGFGAVGMIRILGQGQMPEPRRRAWDSLMTGNDADQWIEVEGLVSVVEKQRFTLTVVGGKITVWINKLGDEVRNRLLGSTVRVRGVCSPVRNSRNQVLGVRLLVPADDCIEIIDATPANLFDLPAIPIGAVMGTGASQTGLTRMVKTRGVVTYKDQLLLFVQDETNALRVLLHKDADIQPGDDVEIAGLPEADGFSPRLIQAVARKTGPGALPPAKPINLISDSDNGNQCDATRCQIDATFLGHGQEGTTPMLNLQDENTKQMFCAYLPSDTQLVSLPPPGSRVRLQGVFKAKMDTVLDFDQVVTAFEMYLDSPADMIVLQSPSWWSAKHTFWVLAGLGLVLSLSLVWIRLLRKQVQQQTHELREEIEQRKRAEVQVENAYKELLEVSRQAGMAEIATNVLHNVGNVLNSVNVSGLLIADKMRNSKVANLAKVAGLMRAHEKDFGNFFANDPKGKQIPDYLANLSTHLTQEQEGVLHEIGTLVSNIDHIKEIVAMQQSYTKASGVIESLNVADLVKDAIRLNNPSMIRHNVKVVCDFGEVPPVSTDKHKVIQILVNLIRNAKHACDDSGRQDKQITLRITGENRHVRIAVSDNGIGIPKENLTRIFNHGFTTRKDGHGFGLHSGANTAKEIGGSLGVFSEGEGRGAMFTLELPLQYQTHANESQSKPAHPRN